MTTAKKGDTVRVNYTGKLDDGTVFDTSLAEGRDPLEFTMGEGRLLPKFEESVVGLEVGGTVQVKIPSDEAYGPYRDELKQDIPRTEFPPDIDPKIGDMYEVQQPNNMVIPVKVVALDEKIVTLDANHPLAGQDLTFDIEVVSIG